MLEVEGATVRVEVEGVWAKAEAEVRCLLLAAYQCGGVGCDALSISSSKCVSIGSGTFSFDSSSSNTLASRSNYLGASL
jgi:hypothetical protein